MSQFTLQQGNTYTYVVDEQNNAYLKTTFVTQTVGGSFTKLNNGNPITIVENVVNYIFPVSETVDLDTTKKIKDNLDNIYTFIGPRPLHPPK